MRKPQKTKEVQIDLTVEFYKDPETEDWFIDKTINELRLPMDTNPILREWINDNLALNINDAEEEALRVKREDQDYLISNEICKYD